MNPLGKDSAPPVAGVFLTLIYLAAVTLTAGIAAVFCGAQYLFTQAPIWPVAVALPVCLATGLGVLGWWQYIIKDSQLMEIREDIRNGWH